MNRLQIALSSVIVVTLPATAHQDDPKARVVPQIYQGPGYRADLDGPLAGGAQFPAQNVVLESWVPLPEFGSFSAANDVWGYVAPSGREYAIIGLWDGTGFAEVTNPGNAQVIGTIPGLGGVWRDIKVYDHYAYIVTEEVGGGIQVVDLSNIDAGQVQLVNTITTGGASDSHNVALNVESGYLYRCGGSGLGLRAYSLEDPANPEFAGAWNERYVHDAQIVTMPSGEQSGEWAGLEIAFCCSGFSNGWVETGLDILDVTDKNNIRHLSQYIYPNGVYSHQGWLSPDLRYFYLGDEVDEGSLELPTTTFVFDVGALNHPTLTGSFTNGVQANGHNLFTRTQSGHTLIFEANYTSGVRVFDAIDPEAPIEVGYFDTHPEVDDWGYSGLWGVHADLPSGTIVGSDRERGLFVLTLDLDLNDPADLDGDGMVGVSDLISLLADWGPCDGGPCPADLDGDGAVAFWDLLLLLSAWTPE